MLLALLLLATTALPPQEPVPPTDSRLSIAIQPKMRADDLIKAFELLKKEKPTSKISLRTPGGILTNITDMSALPNGTLIVVKFTSQQGSKIQFLLIEEIQEIFYL
jgi:hypothetical protein